MIRVPNDVDPSAAPGRMVDIGGFRLRAAVDGGGSPVVVMEAGTWDLGLTWSLVSPRVAAFTTTLTYDRAGLGWSDPSPSPRTVGSMADELHRLLSAVDLAPPYVLVGQSFGALVTRLYAHRHPDEVGAMVLVDPAHEDQLDRFPDAVRAAQPGLYAMQLEMLRGLRTRLEAGERIDPAVLGLPVQLPEDAIDGYRTAALADTSRVDTMLAELELLERGQEEVREATAAGLGDLPLVVLSHGVPAPLPPIVQGGERTARAYEEAWQEMQGEIARLSSNGIRVVAERSGHMVHLDRPELVVQAIRDVVGSVRGEEVA